MRQIEKQASSRRMNKRQQRKVESSLPLVRLMLRRHRELARPARRVGREAGELLQEGCLALVEAVRSHDPARHGHFAPFAMARIHYALSRFAQENRDAIRVPFITQRRRRRGRKDGAGNRHRPDGPPRTVAMRMLRLTPSRREAVRMYAERLSVRADGVSIGELVRERYDLAAEQVVRALKSSPRASEGNYELVERCLQERWTVPDPDVQTPIRQMAKELGCSTGRVTHCEARFRNHIASILSKDGVCTMLLGMAHRREEGLGHRLTEHELAMLDRIARNAGSMEPGQPPG